MNIGVMNEETVNDEIVEGALGRLSMNGCEQRETSCPMDKQTLTDV